MVPNARCGLCREKVAAGGLEEFQHRLWVKCRRIGEVDHHLCAGYSVFEPFAGDGIDATFGRRRDDLVAVLAQNGNSLRADQASAADHDYLHGLLSFAGRGRSSSFRYAARGDAGLFPGTSGRKPGKKTSRAAAPMGAPTVAIEALREMRRARGPPPPCDGRPSFL